MLSNVRWTNGEQVKGEWMGFDAVETIGLGNNLIPGVFVYFCHLTLSCPPPPFSAMCCCRQGSAELPFLHHLYLDATPPSHLVLTRAGPVLWLAPLHRREAIAPFNILDIRSEWEGQEGRIRGANKGSVDIPLFSARATYDPAVGRRIVTPQANKGWLQHVKDIFPPEAKLRAFSCTFCLDARVRSERTATSSW